MDSLYQGLKELDSDTFQRLCFQVLKAKHPGLQLRHVEGAAGDEGLDVFEGNLDGHPAIWQCKSFPNGVRDPQKAQIRNSLGRALQKFSPAHWILCLSVDMDTRAHRWFQRLHNSFASRAEVGLFSASDIVHELIHRRSIRNYFFPKATIDVVELKRLILKTDEMTPEELERITDANAEDLIERMKERDARFNYQIVYDGDIGPASPEPRLPLPGLIATLSSGSKTINVLARDVQALASNPPAFKLSLRGTGIQKALAFWKTGIQQEFTSEELGPVTTDVPFLSSFLNSGNPPARLIVGPPPDLTRRMRVVRVTFRKADKMLVEYPLMELRPTRLGAEEAEFVCKNQNLFFDITVVLPLPLDRSTLPTITFSHLRYLGQDVRQLKKFLDALAALRAGGEMEIFDLAAESVFGTVRGANLGEESTADAQFREVVSDLAGIAERFHLELRLPAELSDEDLRSVLLLKTLINGGSLPIDKISAAVLKGEENRNVLSQMLTEAGGVLRLEHPRCEPMPKLLGQSVDTGPYGLEAEIRINDLAPMLQSFQQAAVGAEVQISARPVGPVRFFLLSPEELTQPRRFVFKKRD
jgi:hypothetical protein